MKKILLLILISFLAGCKTSKLPTEKYNQYEYHKSFTYDQNELRIKLKNPLASPLRIWVFNSNEALQKKLNEINPIELNSKSDSSIVFLNIFTFDNNLNFSSRLGSTFKKIKPVELELPFPRNKEYKILQGNETNYTHNTDFSKYAIDFHLKINDTVSSATNGFVVGLVDQYEYGGKGSEWRSFGNYITIYEPNSGVFIQYAHLVKNGSLVEIGDQVESGQPIALSGNTGQSSIEHLHFNCLIPVETDDGLKSIPIEFVEGYKGSEFKKGDLVRK